VLSLFPWDLQSTKNSHKSHVGCDQISCANYGTIEDKCDITFKMGNMHLFQVHLKWANVWLLVVSAVIVAACPVVPHFLHL